MGEAVSKRLYTIKEAARYLGRSPWAIRHLIWSGVLPHVRQGRRIFVDIFDLDQFIEKHKMTDFGDNYGNALPAQEA